MHTYAAIAKGTHTSRSTPQPTCCSKQPANRPTPESDAAPSSCCCRRLLLLQVAQILALVAGQCQEPQDICSLLLVGRTVRRALQNSIGSLSLSGSGQDLNWAVRVARWLPEHAGLVKHLDTTDIQAPEDSDLVEQLLTAACQLSVLPTRTGFGLDGSVSSLVRLQLQQCTTAFFTPAMLGSLGACSSLTWLELQDVDPASTGPAHSAALSTLTSLEALVINSTDVGALLPASILSATAGMQRLRQLDIGCGVPAAALAHLPTSLEALTVRPRGRHLSPSTALQALQADLTHLSCLQWIEIPGGDVAILNVTLPASVIYLATVTPRVQGAGLSDLQALKLDHVRMPAAARLLRLLKRPVLRSLELGLATCGVHALPPVFAAVGAATQLMRLVLKGYKSEPDPADELPLLQLWVLRISTHLSDVVGVSWLGVCWQLAPASTIGRQMCSVMQRAASVEELGTMCVEHTHPDHQPRISHTVTWLL